VVQQVQSTQPSQPAQSRKEVILKQYDDRMNQILQNISQTNPTALPAFIMTAELNRILVGMVADLAQELRVMFDVLEKTQ
jgi:hypothetical protein